MTKIFLGQTEPVMIQLLLGAKAGFLSDVPMVRSVSTQLWVVFIFIYLHPKLAASSRAGKQTPQFTYQLAVGL